MGYKPVSRILVVDPERIVADRVSEVLSTHGYEAVPSYSVDDAAEQARRLQPDLVLADVGMADMTGVDAARRIFEAGVKCKFLFWSGLPRQRLEEILKGWAWKVLPKPVPERELLNHIRHLLSPIRRKRGTPPLGEVGRRQPLRWVRELLDLQAGGAWWDKVLLGIVKIAVLLLCMLLAGAIFAVISWAASLPLAGAIHLIFDHPFALVLGLVTIFAFSSLLPRIRKRTQNSLP
jgi:DNA-binding response OmpR family regulator